MHEDLTGRVGELEARLARLEEVVADRVLPALDRLPPPLPRPRPAEVVPSPPVVVARSAPPVPVPVPVSAPVDAGARPPAAAPRPTAEPSSPAPRRRALTAAVPAGARRDLEKFVGVSVLGRVGVGALLLAAGYFAQWTYVRIPPVARVASIYGLALLLLGVGVFVRRRASTLYVGILWGGATAAAYLAGVAAKLRYDLVGPEVAVAMLVGACALGDVLARKAKVVTLALVAIAGAAFAPLLVGEASDARTPLLVYLLVVHGWGAWVAARRGWASARVVALVTTAIVAAAWLATWGRHDVSTWTHVQLYLLGFTLPEWGAAVVRGPIAPKRAHVVVNALFVAELVLGVLSMDGSDGLGRWFALVTGLGWVAVAAAARVRAKAPDVLVRGLAGIAGMLLIVASVAYFGRADLAREVRQGGPLVALASLALAALASRRFFGTGDGVAVGAAIVAIFGTAVRDFDPGLGWRATALVAPLALLLVGRTSLLRTAGAGLAIGASFAALTPRTWDDPWGVALAFFAAAPIVLLTLERARWGADRALAGTGATLLGILGVLWALLALGTGWSPVVPAFVNAPTVVGVVLLLTAAAFVARERPPVSGADTRALLGVGALIVVLGGLWREVHAATTGADLADAGRAIETGAFAAVALLAFVAGSVRRRVALDVGGIAAWAVAAAHAVVTIGERGGDFTAAAQIVFVLMPAAFAARRRDGNLSATQVAAALGLGVALLLWFQAVAAMRFNTDVIVVNGRFVSGAVLVAAVAWARGRLPRLNALAAVTAVLLSAVIAIPEVVRATRGIEVLATRRALVSVYGALHAAAVLGIGFVRRDALLRWLALGGFGVVVLKVALFDLNDVSTPIRVLVTGCLGAILLAAAYAYARRVGGPTAGPPAEALDDPSSAASADATTRADPPA